MQNTSMKKKKTHVEVQSTRVWKLCEMHSCLGGKACIRESSKQAYVSVIRRRVHHCLLITDADISVCTSFTHRLISAKHLRLSESVYHRRADPCL